jgi:O-antigen ligase
MWVRHGSKLSENIREGKNIGATLLTLAAASLSIIGIVAIMLFGNLDDRFAKLASTKEGGELLSFTGRDQIWRVALDEWARNPLVGYGSHLFDEEYRDMIGMTFATHGHNQLIDTLARAGTIGAIGLVCFMVMFAFMVFKTAKRTQGLSLALFVLVIVRSISEVPIHLWGYGTEAFTIFFILLMSIEPYAPAEARQRFRRFQNDSDFRAFEAPPLPDGKIEPQMLK